MPLGNSPPAGPVTVDFLKPVIGPDMVGVDQVLRDSLRSDVALIHTVADYIIGSGGKRLRPALLLLAARACGYGGTDHRVLAAVVEMIHTATLLHDDVVDESDLRRGHATANAAFGNAASVLVGDFLYSRAFQLMVGVGSMRVLEIVADATNRIAEGEVMQLMNTGDAALDERAYLAVIERKTATLFEAAARIGAVLGGSERGREDALARYGRHLGIAFQIMDDVLDYSGDAGAIGKNVGDDLAEGKMTLPLIRALAVGRDAEKGVIRHAVSERGRSEFAAVAAALETTGALAWSRERAALEARDAAACLDGLPEAPETAALLQLAAFAAQRTY